jgi:hypothetical protein
MVTHSSSLPYSPCLVSSILLNDICLFVLEVSQREQDDVTGIDPDLQIVTATDQYQ